MPPVGVIYINKGKKVALGYNSEIYGVWPIDAGDNAKNPIIWFPKNDDGWRAINQEFLRIENGPQGFTPMNSAAASGIPGSTVPNWSGQASNSPQNNSFPNGPNVPPAYRPTGPVNPNNGAVQNTGMPYLPGNAVNNYSDPSAQNNPTSSNQTNVNQPGFSRYSTPTAQPQGPSQNFGNQQQYPQQQYPQPQYPQGQYPQGQPGPYPYPSNPQHFGQQSFNPYGYAPQNYNSYQQPGFYGSPNSNVYAPSGNYYNHIPKVANDRLAVLSLVCGIISIPFFFAFGIFGILAVIFSAKFNAKYKAVLATGVTLRGKGIATAGSITGFIGLLFYLILLIANIK